jgi:hypothetical protein
MNYTVTWFTDGGLVHRLFSLVVCSFKLLCSLPPITWENAATYALLWHGRQGLIMCINLSLPHLLQLLLCFSLCFGVWSQ